MNKGKNKETITNIAIPILFFIRLPDLYIKTSDILFMRFSKKLQ